MAMRNTVTAPHQSYINYTTKMRLSQSDNWSKRHEANTPCFACVSLLDSLLEQGATRKPRDIRPISLRPPKWVQSLIEMDTILC